MAPEPDSLDAGVLQSLRALGGPEDPDFLPGLLREFLKHGETAVIAMRAAVAAADSKTLDRTAHGLKGSGASLGAKPLAALCAELQALGAAGKASSAGPRVEAAAAEFLRVKARARSEISPR